MSNSTPFGRGGRNTTMIERTSYLTEAQGAYIDLISDKTSNSKSGFVRTLVKEHVARHGLPDGTTRDDFEELLDAVVDSSNDVESLSVEEGLEQLGLEPEDVEFSVESQQTDETRYDSVYSPEELEEEGAALSWDEWRAFFDAHWESRDEMTEVPRIHPSRVDTDNLKTRKKHLRRIIAGRANYETGMSDIVPSSVMVEVAFEIGRISLQDRTLDDQRARRHVLDEYFSKTIRDWMWPHPAPDKRAAVASRETFISTLTAWYGTGVWSPQLNTMWEDAPTKYKAQTTKYVWQVRKDVADLQMLREMVDAFSGEVSHGLDQINEMFQRREVPISPEVEDVDDLLDTIETQINAGFSKYESMTVGSKRQQITMVGLYDESWKMDGVKLDARNYEDDFADDIDEQWDPTEWTLPPQFVREEVDAPDGATVQERREAKPGVSTQSKEETLRQVAMFS